ncbi:peptidase M15 [Cellulomonas sp. WB94]|nr:peptidase M15 [Cellulomonas sp. WB94]
MTPTSWRPGCPVPVADLRYVTVSHVTFDGAVATGELVVHADLADGVVGVFRALFAAGYPIRSMRLVDDFGGSDDASMAADNTSAFNCRAITRGTGWSEHAYGRALDLDPVENPYVRGSLVLPVAGKPFAARPDLPGVVHADDAVVRAFADAGWQWGGYWASPTDYQHFSTTGR